MSSIPYEPKPVPAPDPITVDSLLPPAMAARAEQIGVKKAATNAVSLLVLAGLAGAFISLGAIFATTVSAGSVSITTAEGAKAYAAGLPYGVVRLLSGVVFSLGLILVIVGGAELFTGNNLIVMAWASRRVSTASIVRNWTIVYAGNFIGAAATAVGVYLSGIHDLGNREVAETALAIASAKVSLSFGEAFFRGVFGNALVCLAVWLGFSARTTTDKILGIVFPITAFVAAGFEHSIANMYFVPLGMLLSGEASGDLTWNGFLLGNLLPVTLGNVAGGSVMVGLAYWFIYLRKR